LSLPAASAIVLAQQMSRHAMRFSPILLVAALALPFGTPAPVQAQSAPGGEEVVARVDGQPLTMTDVLATAQDVLPPEIRQMPPALLLQALPAEVRRQLIERTITDRALSNAARQSGLDKEPETSRRMRRAADQELQQSYLSREVSGHITEAALRQRYEAMRKQGEEEVHARHILVKTEAEAKHILAELHKGADFAAVARSHSTDPGGKDGGDLGFFKHGDMVPEFAKAAFALKPGETSQEPVKSPFGWHVIRIVARRPAPMPSFEEATPQLRQQAIEAEIDALVQRVRSAAKVEIVEPAAPAGLLHNAAPPPAPPPSRR
jgi:peptidyl-prolyl cis-trans isomerase C